MFLNWLNRYNNLSKLLKRTQIELQILVINKYFFLKDWSKMSDLIWQEGFLIDFTQKKVMDKWVRKFLTHSSYLFSERVLFDLIVKVYINFITNSLVTNTWYETKQLSSFISLTVITIFIIFILNDLIYLYNWLF